MPFDPTLPGFHAPNSSEVMRAQLNGLNEKIPTSAEIGSVVTLTAGESATATLTLNGTVLRLDLGLPQGFTGAPGPQGEPGPAFATVIVDGVITLNPGEPATVTATLIGNEVHLVMGIPRGDEGATGPQGIQGPPFANVIIDGVTTLNPGESAFVNASFDGTFVHLAFGIPRGADGSPGAPGEVTLAQLNDAITAALASAASNSSANTNAVATLDTPFADPDTEANRQKINELILAQRRS